MSRASVNINDDSKWVWNRLAAHYRHRPPYPPAAIEAVRRLCPPGGAAVDIGAGMGAFALPLAAGGISVSCVEPARAMLELLRSAAAALGGAVNCVHAAAEAVPLPTASQALAVLADSLQWVQEARAAAEVKRLLAPGGACAVVEPLWADMPFMRELEALLRKENPRSSGMRRAPNAGAFLSLAVPGGQARREVVDDAVPLSEGVLKEILGTHSFLAPALGQARFLKLCAAASEIWHRHGRAPWARRICITWARAAGPPAPR